MRVLVIALGLSLTGQAAAQDISSNLESSFYSQNANQQNNYAFGGGALARNTFGKGLSTCDSPKLTVGVIPTWQEGWSTGGQYYGGGDGLTAGVSVSIPFGGAIERCKQLQKTILRSAELQYQVDVQMMDSIKKDIEYKRVMRCHEFDRNGIIVAEDIFNCSGISVMMSMNTE